MVKKILPNKPPHPLVLIVLDGWGVAPPSEANALSRAKLPFFNELISRYPCLTLAASGAAVGLAAGAPGTSEAGHLTLGAGRACFQGEALINHSLTDKTFFKNQVLLTAVKQVKKYQSRLHLVGLLARDNIHADREHLQALLTLAQRKKLPQVYLHLFLAAGSERQELIAETEQLLARLGVGKIASLSDSADAMDNGNRWERTERVYRLLTGGKGERTGEPQRALRKSKVLAPSVIVDHDNQPRGLIGNNDAVIFFHHRPDGARQLAKSLAEPEWPFFKRAKINNLFIASLTEYEKGLAVAVAFPQQLNQETLGQVLAQAGLKQLRLATAEKYALVTNFFNGGSSAPLTGEEQLLASAVAAAPAAQRSAKAQLTATAVTKLALEKIADKQHDFLLLNLADADSCAHSGDVAATVRAVEGIDKCLERLVKKTLEQGGWAFITADHGQVEAMLDLQLNQVLKEHSANPVPLIIVGREVEGYRALAADAPISDLSLVPLGGSLADVAPTILKVLQLEQPAAMSGRNLLAT